MGRPRRKKMSSKDRLLTFRLSEAEKELLIKHSKEAGMTKSEYTRQLISGNNPPRRMEIVYNSPEVLKIFGNLENVTERINRIAHDLNSGVKWNKELHEEVVNCLNELQRMKDELTELKVDYHADWDKIFAQADDLISRGSCEPLTGDEL